MPWKRPLPILIPTWHTYPLPWHLLALAILLQSLHLPIIQFPVVGMLKFGLVRFFKDLAEPRTGLQVRSRQSAELRTGPLVQVWEGSVLGSGGSEPRTELFCTKNSLEWLWIMWVVAYLWGPFNSVKMQWKKGGNDPKAVVETIWNPGPTVKDVDHAYQPLRCV